ncbi:hypothetical protein GOP47_0024350 [Adiantum capillus-veneris]|uniref:Uncharacterized protein n=1 Tax=Adiantum capillus-veneris TaxID=13818 RepID=A0A9D4U1Z7_ADICA|nr:hypothetical protein GOP47_0024350 [Adiantum capillus-veneris]
MDGAKGQQKEKKRHDHPCNSFDEKCRFSPFALLPNFTQSLHVNSLVLKLHYPVSKQAFQQVQLVRKGGTTMRAPCLFE